MGFILFYRCLYSTSPITHPARSQRQRSASNNPTHQALIKPISTRHLMIMPLPTKLHQVPIVLELRIRLPLQAPSRHLDIHLDILDQALFTHVVVLGPDKTEDQQVHARAIEVAGEGVQDVDFLGLGVGG